MILNEKLISEYLVRVQYQTLTENLQMRVTNYRLIITKDKESVRNAKFRFYYQDISWDVKSNEGKTGEVRYVGRITWKKNGAGSENMYVRFGSQEEMNTCNREISLLRTLIDDITKLKFKFLAEDEALLNAYEALVLKDLVSEEEFWHQKPEFREWNKISSLANQCLAKTSKNVVKSLYTGGNTRIEGLKLDEIGKMKLLKREPLLMQKYMYEVKSNGMKDEDFWNLFEQEQREKNTVLVGGVNPISVWEDVSGRDKIELELKVDINKNTETFDLTSRFFDGSKDEKRSLIEKFNERSIRVLTEETLLGRETAEGEIEEEMKVPIEEKKAEGPEKMMMDGVWRKIQREGERKPNAWEEEAFAALKKQLFLLENDSQEYRNAVFDEESKGVRAVFEQTLKWINQRLSKKSVNFAHYDDEFKNFEEEWRNLHQESNKVLSFFFMNLRKASENKEENLRAKYWKNCKEIAEILQKLKERIHKLKQNKIKTCENTLKCLNNLLERCDAALKLLH